MVAADAAADAALPEAVAGVEAAALAESELASAEAVAAEADAEVTLGLLEELFAELDRGHGDGRGALPAWVLGHAGIGQALAADSDCGDTFARWLADRDAAGQPIDFMGFMGFFISAKSGLGEMARPPHPLRAGQRRNRSRAARPCGTQPESRVFKWPFEDSGLGSLFCFPPEYGAGGSTLR